MCGLVGMMFNSQGGCITADTQLFEDMLYMDALRGEDSTGIAALYNNNELQVIKEACDANYFRYTAEFIQLKKDLVSCGKAVMGHNRKKTVGKIDETTAHPFIIEDRYAFMHNGTLSSHKHLANTEVDSEALGIHLMKCQGDPDAIEQALSVVYGAYACVWIDQKLEKMYMLRNDERPLYLAKTSAGYVFGSEYGIVMAACLRNRMKVDDINPIEKDVLHTFDLSKYTVELKKDTLTVKKATPLKTTTSNSGEVKKTTAGNSNTPSLLHSIFPGGTSKNAFKRFRNKFIGTQIPFYLDDFVERSHPLVDGNWLVFGQSDNVEAKHLIRGVVSDVSSFDMSHEYFNSLCYGKIESCEYEEKTKVIVIQVGEVQLAHGKYLRQGDKHETQATKH